MDSGSIALIFRGITLLLVTFGGILCIYLGWRLYRDGINSAVNSEFSKGEQWKITLRSAGPGVFFALFGMGILVWIVHNQTEIQTLEPEPAEQGLNVGSGLHDLLEGRAYAAAPKQTGKVCFRVRKIRMQLGASLESKDFQMAVRESVTLLKQGRFPDADRERVSSTILVLSRLDAAKAEP
jgi:hypothetical protein